MAVTAITLSSNALVLLGGQPIASFTDGESGSDIAALLYETTYHSMLTDTRWHFATRTVRLAQLLEKPENGFGFKFALPTDCLTVVKCSDRNYEIYERELYCHSSDVLIEYVYPVDEINLPAYFVKALEYNLAAQFAIPLTDNATKADFYYNLYQDFVKKARFVDASQRPNSIIEDSPYISARR